MSLPSAPGMRVGEEVVVQADLGRHGVGGRDPVQRPLDLAAVRRAAAARLRIVGAAQLDDLARRRP